MIGTSTGGDMNAKVHDLMTESVVTTEPHASIDRVRRLLRRNKIGAVPIVDSEGHPVGIVSATDLVESLKADSPVSTIMTEKVYTVSRYEDVSVAARIMRKHKIHRVVVTNEKTVVGVISSFDLLELVEGHRWVAKNAPSASGRRKSKRA
jgi:CBS domain-containing protein